MKDEYIRKRDEAAYLSHYTDSPNGSTHHAETAYKEGADWANARAEKVIAEKDEEIKSLHEKYNFLKHSFGLETRVYETERTLFKLSEAQIKDRDAMIQKMEKVIQACYPQLHSYYGEAETEEYICVRKLADKTLSELEEFYAKNK